MTESRMKGRRKDRLIILAVAVVIVYYLIASNFWIYTSQQNQISNLNTIYQNYVSTHSYSNSEYYALKSERNSLNDAVNLKKVYMFANHQTINQPASSYTLYVFSVDYAGYISVVVESSTAFNIYVRVIWSSSGASFDKQITVGAGGEAIFPVLPCDNIQVRIGNTNYLGGATETVSIGYHY